MKWLWRKRAPRTPKKIRIPPIYLSEDDELLKVTLEHMDESGIVVSIKLRAGDECLYYEGVKIERGGNIVLSIGKGGGDVVPEGASLTRVTDAFD